MCSGDKKDASNTARLSHDERVDIIIKKQPWHEPHGATVVLPAGLQYLRTEDLLSREDELVHIVITEMLRSTQSEIVIITNINICLIHTP